MAYNSINISGASATDSLKIKPKKTSRRFKGRSSKARPPGDKPRRPSGHKPPKTREEAKAQEESYEANQRSAYEKALAAYNAKKGKK